MKCPNCGADLPDGAKFCGVCGKPTQPAAPAQGQPVQGQPMQGQPMQGQPVQGQPMQGQPMQGRPMQGQPMQGQPMQGRPMQGQPMPGQPMQGGYNPNMMHGQMPGAVNPMVDMWKLFVEAFTKPYTAVKSIVEKGRGLQGFLLAVLEFVAVLMFVMIHLPYGKYSSYSSWGIWNFGQRSLQSLYTLIIVAGIFMLTCLAAYVFRDKRETRFTFMNIMGMFGVATVYMTCIAFLVFLFGLFSADFAFMFLDLGKVLWVAYSSIIMWSIVGGKKDVRAYKVVFSQGVIFIGLMILVFLIEKAADISFSFIL